ncbi:HNH endonuclease family protein [Streptomyces hainanensis]|uniref:HNH endonuclease n=1 Tax=Streptomyces hainanensis TaxID=402648 RepID=A0A4R4SQS2_9ACTN|nr:HNH endonuclease family protein [Streptomyces hainanensis]TDC65004.1 HNH endonuclease [Streptomyces hainanensis]
MRAVIAGGGRGTRHGGLTRTAIGLAAVALTVGGCTLEDVDGDDETGGTARPSESSESSGASGSPEAPGAGGSGVSDVLPGLPAPDEARELLAGLTVAEPRPMTGYSRDAFSHWTSTDGCTTRQTVLIRDAEDVAVDDDCAPTSGSWRSAYDGETFEDPGDLDIDHIVPLANAWRSGADSWTDDRREELANDLQGPQLLAVSAASNRSKGDQSPDEWLPPAEDFHCTYAVAWTTVKDTYELTVTDTERDELTRLLDTCP